MSEQSRTRVLGVCVLALMGLVVADRAGLLARLSRSTDSSDGPSLAALHDRYQRDRALLDAQPEWAAAEAQAERVWAELGPVVLRAETRALAEAALRERVRAALRIEGITAPDATGIAGPAAAPAGGAAGAPTAGAAGAAGVVAGAQRVRVERLRFRVAFDAAEHAALVQALDRVATLASPRVRIESLSVTGPGEKLSAQAGLTASMEIEVVAIIGPSTDPALALSPRDNDAPQPGTLAERTIPAGPIAGPIAGSIAGSMAGPLAGPIAGPVAGPGAGSGGRR
jgi:hypothetical protein